MILQIKLKGRVTQQMAIITGVSSMEQLGALLLPMTLHKIVQGALRFCNCRYHMTGINLWFPPAPGVTRDSPRGSMILWIEEPCESTGWYLSQVSHHEANRSITVASPG